MTLELLPRSQKQKVKLDSDYDDSDDGFDDESFTVDEKSHDTLIQSLKSSLKTNRKRVQEAEGIVDPKGNLLNLRLSKGPVSDAEILNFFDDKDKEFHKKLKRAVKPKILKKGEKSLSLTTSLKKPVIKRIQREILYNNTKRDVSKWNSIVYHNRLADQLIFPLPEKNAIRKDGKKELEDNFVPITPLEEKLATLIHGEGYVEKRKAEIFGIKEGVTEEDTYVRTVEEALERHHELARLRAVQSYEMAKAKRNGKIKSKKYHRLQRKQKIRSQLKEFEELQKTNPEAAMLKLEELDRARIQERMNLKHRNTSKWAKTQIVRAKYNRESRAELSEQLKISRDLTRKVAESSEESDPDDVDLELPGLVKSSLDNPWCLTGSIKDNDKVNMYYTGYKKFWDDVNARKERERKRKEREEARQEEQRKLEEMEQQFVLSQEKVSDEEEKPLPDILKKITKKVKKSKKKTKSKLQTKAFISSEDVPQELSLEDLDDLLTSANQRLEEKVKKGIKRLKGEKKESKLPQKSKKDRNRKNSRNQDGDIDEIRDFNIDDSEINIEKDGNVIEDDDIIPSQSISASLKNTPMRETIENKTGTGEKKEVEKVIDPSHFLEIRKSKKYDMKESDLGFGEENLEEMEVEEDEEKEVEHLKMIAEAFEDEDLIGEFERKKAEEIAGSKPQDINLSLPGWGEWGGQDIKLSRHKRRRFIKKAPLPPPRRDGALPHVILNENGDSGLRHHQVKELPFPFTRVSDFEKTVRAPVGRTWLPEQAMKSLIAPKVITRLGKVIQPIDEDILVKSNRQKTLQLLK